MLRFISISLLLYLSLFSSSTTFFSQSCQKVLLIGKVVDTLKANQFYNLMIINQSTGKGVFGQPDGSFQVYAGVNDSILLSIRSYSKLSFRVHADSNCQMNVGNLFIRNYQEIKEVIIKPLKSIQSIKEERLNLAVKETKTTAGLDAFSSPITFLYERFSKEGTSKQKAAELTYYDQQRKVVKALLTIYVSFDIIDLVDSDFDSFISFLNLNETFLKTSTDIELVTFIKDKFDHFKDKKNN